MISTFTANASESQNFATFELRGFFGQGDELEVSLRNSRDGSSRWVRVGQKIDGVTVEKADSKSGKATVVIEGIRRELKLSGETSAIFQSPMTMEDSIVNVRKITRMQLAVINRPGVSDRYYANQKSVDDAFAKAHPEFEELKKKVSASSGSQAPTREDIAAVLEHDRLERLRDEERASALKMSNDSDLLEYITLGESATAMRVRLRKSRDGN